MRKFSFVLIVLLVAAMVCGCGQAAAPAPTETTVPTAPAVMETEAPETTEPETTEPETTEAPTEPDPEGVLLLTVSEITLTLVGDSENIYMGTVPAETVEWVSENPDVVSVENGVITAVSVGDTVIHAACGGQEVSCIAGCLAEDEEALKAVDGEIRRSPMRLPPVLDSDPFDFFADAGIIGDSITYCMMCHELKEGMLGSPTFLCRGGVSLNGFVLNYKNLIYNGNEIPLEDVVQKSGVQKVLIQLGQNDLRYKTIEDSLENYRVLIERLRSKTPGLKVYIETCFPEWIEYHDSNERNEKIEEFNSLLWGFAEENDCKVIDVYPYAVDHNHRMVDRYNLDRGIHLNQEGCVAWRNFLRAYAYIALLEETV